jgi:hypothetical protein
MVKSQKIKLGLTLFLLGMLGVLSLIALELAAEKLPSAIVGKYSDLQIRLLMLINPTIMLLLGTVAGTLWFDKVGLSVPTINKLVNQIPPWISFKEQAKSGITAGLILGFSLAFFNFLFRNALPTELLLEGREILPSILSRLLYRGITEEIIMRFGAMTFIVWIAFVISSSKSAGIYWFGIIVSASLFAIAHLPIAFQFMERMSVPLFFYIFLGNAIGGVVFGWLYWEKGLESAILAHVFAQLAIVSMAAI